jgi:hypothetical protein
MRWAFAGPMPRRSRVPSFWRPRFDVRYWPLADESKRNPSRNMASWLGSLRTLLPGKWARAMSRWRKSQAGDSYLALITERDRKNGAGNPAQSLTERKAISIRSGSGFNRCSSIGSTHRREFSCKKKSSTRPWLNVYSVPSLSAYGRTAGSAVIWVVLGRRISDHPRA